MQIFAILLLVVAVVVGLSLFGLTLSLLKYLVGGLIIGALARLVLPGREKIGLLGTALVGIAGGMAGGVAGAALHVGGLLEMVLSVAAAAVLLAVLGFREGRGKAR